MPSARQANAPKLAPVFTPTNDRSLRAPNKLAIAGSMIAAVALTIALIAHFLMASNPVKHPTGSQGSVAPDFTLSVWNPSAKSDAKPETVTLSQLRGHPLVVFFWSGSSVQSEAVAPEFEALFKEYHSYGIGFLGIAVATNQQDGNAFIKRTGLTFANGPDTTASIARSYSLAGTPSYVFIDANGKVTGKLEGQVESSSLDASLRRYVLDGMPAVATPKN